MCHVIRSHDHCSNHSRSTFMGRGPGSGPFGRRLGRADQVVRSVSSLCPGVFSLMLQATPTGVPPDLPIPGLVLGPFRVPISQPWLPVSVALIRKSFSLFLFREYRARENIEAFRLLTKRTPLCPSLAPVILSLLSSPFEAWETKNLRALEWLVDFSPAPWTGSPFQPKVPWVGREFSYLVSQVSIAPREQEEAQASLGSAGWGVGGCLSLETLSGKEEFYRLLFTKKKKQQKKPRGP